VADNPRYLLELEAMPSTAGTPMSRLKRALKTLLWYRFRCRGIQELPREQPGQAPQELST
jgi:hypothetical protein